MPFAEKDFLGELWGRKKEDELIGENPEDINFGIFLDMKIAAERDPGIAELIDDLEKNLLRYAKAESAFLGAKLRWESEGSAPETRRDFEVADRGKKAVHDSLISQLNVVSRAFHRANLDNNWRKKIGVDRNQIAAWALTVSDHLVADTLKEHGLET